jgi:hypothetical protein
VSALWSRSPAPHHRRERIDHHVDPSAREATSDGVPHEIEQGAGSQDLTACNRAPESDDITLSIHARGRDGALGDSGPADVSPR